MPRYNTQKYSEWKEEGRLAAVNHLLNGNGELIRSVRRDVFKIVM